MELTKEPIPIPGGDYLIQLNDLSTCSPVVYKDAAKLKKAVKVCPIQPMIHLCSSSVSIDHR